MRAYKEISKVIIEWKSLRNNEIINYLGTNASKWKHGTLLDMSEYNFLCALLEKLKEIATIRMSVQEMQNLLTSNEAQRLQIHQSNCFSILSDVRDALWEMTAESTMKWYTATANWHNQVASEAIKLCSIALRHKINLAQKNPHLVLNILKNYPLLLQNKYIFDQLKSETLPMIQHIAHFVENFQEHFQMLMDDDLSSQITSNDQIMKIVKCYEWARQLKQIAELVTELQFIGKREETTDLMNQVHTKIQMFRAQNKDLSKQLFLKWQKMALNKINMIDQTSKVMELDLQNGGDLIVHYSENLVSLMQEIRTLQEYGFHNFPKNLLRAFQNAKKFYKYAIQLKQIANFYNTMHLSIIQSQKGMLLLEASQFEKLITSDKNNVTWDEPDKCSQFIQQLTNHCELLSMRNRELRSLHNYVGTSIQPLMECNLFSKKQYAIWMQTCEHIMNTVFKKQVNHKFRKYTKQSIAVWIAYWDSQLFKIFQFQYRKCVFEMEEKLNNGTAKEMLKFFAPIECQLMYEHAHKQTRFKPTTENLTSKISSIINDILDKPNSFTGFGDGTIYKQILQNVDRQNKELLDKIQSIKAKCTKIVDKLTAFALTFSHFCEIGSYLSNFESFASDHIPNSRVEEYETQIKFIRAKMNEIDGINELFTIDCFKVSLVPFKQGILAYVRCKPSK